DRAWRHSTVRRGAGPPIGLDRQILQTGRAGISAILDAASVSMHLAPLGTLRCPDAMPLYAYVALAENGAYLTGESVADSQAALRTALPGRGRRLQQAKAKRSRLGLGRRVRTEEFALFNQEFTALIRAGLTVLDALALASDRPDSPALGKILSRVHADVRDGLSLS